MRGFRVAGEKDRLFLGAPPAGVRVPDQPGEIGGRACPHHQTPRLMPGPPWWTPGGAEWPMGQRLPGT